MAGKKIKVEEFKEFKNTFLIDGETYWKNKDKRAFVLAKTEVKNSSCKGKERKFLPWHFTWAFGI